VTSAATSLAFDHAVVVVPDLAAASAAFAAAGFAVTPGGRHAGLPTANALVAFADGGYLELLAPRDAEARASLRVRAARRGWEAELRRASAIGRRFLPRLAMREGVADVVLRRAGLARFAAESRRRGVVMTGPVAMGRERPDGARLEWTLVLPAADVLPFLIEDVTPRERRVPGEPAATTHANGACGVAVVTVRAADVPGTAFAWADLFGAALGAGPDGATRLGLAGLEVRVVPGAPEGACGITVRGVRTLPPALVALGVHGEDGA
jgi:hypothetical protein